MPCHPIPTILSPPYPFLHNPPSTQTPNPSSTPPISKKKKKKKSPPPHNTLPRTTLKTLLRHFSRTTIHSSFHWSSMPEARQRQHACIHNPWHSLAQTQTPLTLRRSYSRSSVLKIWIERNWERSICAKTVQWDEKGICIYRGVKLPPRGYL